MSATRSQRLRAVREAEASGLITDDRSRIIAELANGWTLRIMTRAGDFRREGHLMHNCAGKYVPQLVPNIATFSMADRPDLADDQCQLELVSLRDADNIPHVTAWMLPGHHLYATWGRGGDEPSASKRAMLIGWCEQEGVKWGGLNEGQYWQFFTTMRGIYSHPLTPEVPLAPHHAGPGDCREHTRDRLSLLRDMLSSYDILCDVHMDHLSDKLCALRRVIERNDLTTHHIETLSMLERQAGDLIHGAVTTHELTDDELRAIYDARSANRPPMLEQEQERAGAAQLIGSGI